MSSSSLDGVRARLMFKLILVGDSGAGKSCLMRAFHAGTFNKDSESTIGVDFCTKKVRLPGEVEGEAGDVVKVQVWDTAGHERFHSITNAYFRNASGCMVVCDATRPHAEARRSVQVWTEAVRSVTPDALFVLVCSKCDMVVPSSGGALSLPGCMRASAKTGEGVADAFDALVARVYEEKALPALRGGRSAIARSANGTPLPTPRRHRVLATGVTLLDDEYSSSSSLQRASSESEARCPACSLM